MIYDNMCTIAYYNRRRTIYSDISGGRRTWRLREADDESPDASKTERSPLDGRQNMSPEGPGGFGVANA